MLRDKYIYLNVLTSLVNLLYINSELIQKFGYSGYSKILYLETFGIIVLSPYSGLTSAYIARKRPSDYFLSILKAISIISALIFASLFLFTFNFSFLFIAGASLNMDFLFIRNNDYRYVFFRNFIHKFILLAILLLSFKITLNVYMNIYCISNVFFGVLGYLFVFRKVGLLPDLNLICKLYKNRSFFILASVLNIAQSIFSNSTIFFLKLFGFNDSLIGQYGILEKIAKSSLIFISPLAITSSNRLKLSSTLSLSAALKELKNDLALVSIFHGITLIFLLYHFIFFSNLNVIQFFLYLTLGLQFFFQTILLQLYYLNGKIGIRKYLNILVYVTVFNILLILFFKITNIEIFWIVWIQEFVLFYFLLSKIKSIP